MSWFSKRTRKPKTKALPKLYTERLVLRGFELSDAVDMFAYAKNPNVGPMAGWEPHKTVEDSRAVIKRFIEKGEEWAIVEKKTGHVIGAIGLHNDGKRAVSSSKELGYTLGEESWGMGYGTEACRAVLDYAFDTLDMNTVGVGHFPHNQRSKKLIKKLGFTYEGTIRCAWRLPDGSVADELIYSITQEEYEAQRAAREEKQCRR